MSDPPVPWSLQAQQSQQYYRDMAKAETERRGFKEGDLQWLWRNSGCFARQYDSGEVNAAICDALTREGQTAWNGDGTSCVEQMIQLQWDRAEKAEAEVRRLSAVPDATQMVREDNIAEWFWNAAVASNTVGSFREFVRRILRGETPADWFPNCRGTNLDEGGP